MRQLSDFANLMRRLKYGKAELMYEESDIAILALGSMVDTAFNVKGKT